MHSDFENLVKKTHPLLPYSKFYFSGVLGGGLAILSKWPLETTTMWKYPLNGRPTAFWRGDWYVGKGIGIALIRHPSGKLLEIFNTHVHSHVHRGLTDRCMHHMDSQKTRTVVIGSLRHGKSLKSFARRFNAAILLSG